MKLIDASKLEEFITKSLTGIDQTETESEYGWWETSVGSEFGAGVLAELRALIEAAPEVSSEPVGYATDESIKTSLRGGSAIFGGLSPHVGRGIPLYTTPQDQTALIRELVDALEKASEVLDPFDHKVQIAKVQAAITRAKEAIK